MLKQTIKVPGVSPDFVQTYTYDALNRLAAAEEKQSTTTTWKQEFGYDRYGNRNFVTGSGHTTTLGNTTRDALYQTFTYDGENKQMQVNSGSTVLGQYWYDGDGKRVKKYVPGTGETTIFIYDAAGKEIAEYSTIVEGTSTAKVNYLTSDHLGSPRINTDANGAIISRHDYHPFGEEIGGAGGRTTGLSYGTDGVRKQFTTYERDIESDLDFAEARMYANRLGRFSGADPLLSSGSIYAPQTWNRYSYALNNPVKLTDPSGLFVWNGSLGGSATDEELKKQKGGQKILDRRNDIRNAITEASKSARDSKLTPDQQSEILRGVNAYGKEGDVNGVSVGYGKVKEGAEAETKYLTDLNGKVAAFSSDEKGKVTANVVVTFGEGKKITADSAAHEGSHTADRQALGRAFEQALQGTDVNLDPVNLPQNITKYATELRAYRVSSYINQATNTPTEVWNKGWNAADRDKAINSLLKNSSVYKLTPKEPGQQIYTTKP